MTAPPDRPRPHIDALAVDAAGLGIRNRGQWNVRDSDFSIPRGRIAALVGPNGAGKSSLLAVAAGLRLADQGTLRVLGHRPGTHAVLPQVGVLLQDRPLHQAFTVAETLRMGRQLNPQWDDAIARTVLADSKVPLHARIRRLSAGQRTCVALALALGKRPELLLLDEPMADLDPLLRHAMMAALMTSAAEHGTTIVMSSHIVAELPLICDYVLLMAHGRILIADDAEFVQAAHTLVTHTCDDPTAPPPTLLEGNTVIETKVSGRRLTAMLQLPTNTDGAVSTTSPSLEEILLAYMRNMDAPPLLAPAETTGSPTGTRGHSHVDRSTGHTP